MIIPSDEKRQSVDVPHPASPSDDPPPRYTPLTDSPPPPPSIPSESSTSISPSPPLPKATNYVLLQRTNGKVAESWVIDPYLVIPTPFLPPLPAGESSTDRKNLSVSTTNGPIAAELRVMGKDGQKGKKATVYLKSVNGYVNLAFHETDKRPPTSLTTITHNGQMTLSLPRSFRGPINVRTGNGRTRYSAAVSEHVTILSEERTLARSFLGSWEQTGEEGENDESMFDSIDAESRNGNVLIQFVDEIPPKKKEEEGLGRKKSSWMKWLGL